MERSDTIATLASEMRAYTLQAMCAILNLKFREDGFKKLVFVLEFSLAIYHLEVKMISRSQGRSSVAAAAYRSCDKLVDDRTGITHNFLKKEGDLVHSEILLPQNAPSWMKDRTLLWNAVEKAEVRKDAQLAREIVITLPHELTQDQNWDLARAFVQKEFVDLGMVADINFHRGHSGDQPHVHIMLSTREVMEEGFGKKDRSWNARDFLENIRESWANTCNHTLALHGHDIRIDHRTLEAQGIDLEPQTKIGPKDAQEHMARFKEHQDIARENGERILENPSIVLDALTSQYSTFTHQDIARIVNRHTADESQFEAAYHKVLACEELVFLGKDEKGRERYTSHEMMNLEMKLVWEAKNMAEVQSHGIELEKVEHLSNKYELTGQAKEAFEYLAQEGDFKNLIGIAGSGKSYLLGAVREAYEEQGNRVIGMALAGKAAMNLQESSGIESRTIASYIRAWDKGFDKLTDKDIVVIDEAAMVDSRQYAKIVHEASGAGAKIIAAFDPEQLQPISAGAPARAIAERVGFSELTEVRRQKEAWQKEATQEFGRGNTLKGLEAYDRQDCIHTYNTPNRAKEAMLDNWYEMRGTHPEKTQIMLAFTQAEAKSLNEGARARLMDDGLIGGADQTEQKIQTSQGLREFTEGDRIYFLKNEYQDLDVRNGTLGTIEKMNGQEFSIRIDSLHKGEEGRLMTLNTEKYNHLDHGYAATIYKGQGATVDHAHILASRYLDKHSTYVAMSRHRETANLYCDKITFPSVKDMADRLSREQYKDYSLDFSKQRGLEVKEEFRLRENDRMKAPEISKDFLQKGFERGEA